MAVQMKSRRECRLLLFLSSVCLFCSVDANDCSSGLMGYDMLNLTGASSWKFSSNGTKCVSNGTVVDCVSEMSFCQPLTGSTSCQDASVCQVSVGNDYKLAGFSTTPFTTLPDPSLGFRTNFPLGDDFTRNNSTCKLNTTINFRCNLQKPWPAGAGQQKVPYEPEIKFIAEKCLYNVTFDFAGACLRSIPATVTNQMSAGSVLVIIFLVFMVSYFVFGAMWNIACRGARGKEAVPNLEFWTDLPVYIADGFLFTFRCGQVESSSYESI
ncbi:uncharacterized protein LOC124113380 [Haliotis rufescens]|uniref:uncharacterized protein LOC124113380 n=1 Tax=Haliotis rufescens TaxID=6454 RepID=UPI001EAFE447|nr:uncharacterized protein LOC124113380 [Haliotis rufescens]